MRPLLIVLALVAAAGAAEPAPLAVDGDGPFLVLSEFVVLDAVGSVPAAVADRERMPLADWLRALGETKPPVDLTNDMAAAELVRVGRRWLIVVRYRSFVRPSAIAVIDERVASGLLLPPTPPPGADPGRPLAGPTAQAEGLTIAAGTARIFCGVRSTGRSLAVAASDVAALARLAQVPTAEELADLIAHRAGD